MELSEWHFFQKTRRMPTYDQFFIWLNKLKTTLYETEDYSGEPAAITDAMFINMVHYRAMPLQVRQVRVKRGGNCMQGHTKYEMLHGFNLYRVGTEL